MIRWIVNSLYDCCCGYKKHKCMMKDDIKELSKEELDQIRNFLLRPLRCC